MGSTGSRTSYSSGTTATSGVTPSIASYNGGQDPTIVATQQQAQSANNATFSDTDPNPYHELSGGGRNYYLAQTFNIDTKLAVQDYLHDQPVAGSMYSPSQELNNSMEKGKPLTANQQYMAQSLLDGSHNLGQNLTLTHYGRVSLIDNFAKNAGLSINHSNYGNLKDSDLQKFVGSTHSLQKFLSTSYNDFRHAPANNPFTDKAVKLNIKAPAKTQGFMPGNGPGGQLGELVLAPATVANPQNFRITGARFRKDSNGRVLMKRSGAQSYPAIEFDIEFF
jgi:hypothetical protein